MHSFALLRAGAGSTLGKTGFSVLHIGVLLVVALAPLPLGSNRPWSWSLLCLFVAALLGLWVVEAAREGRGPAVSLRRIAVPAALFGFVCLIVVLQAMPGLPEVLQSPYWSLVAPDNQITSATISAAPHQSWTALMRLIAYGGIFWLALQLFRKGQRAERAVMTLALATAVYSAYGLAVQFSGSKSILWYAKWAYQNDVTSTFVNRNSFATYAGLGVLCSICAFASARSSIPNGRSGSRVRFRDAFAAVTDLGLFGYAALAALAINATALVLSASRAGVASTVVATVILVVGIGARKGRSRLLTWALPILVAAVSVGLFQMSGERLETRLDRFVATGGMAGIDRLEAYRQTITAIGDNVVFGTGYGTFSDVFKSYRSANIPVLFDKAHNTYLELAFELGAVAGALLALAVMLLALRCLVGVRRRSRHYIIAWLGFCASVLVGIHGLVDFSLQIPAVAVFYATLLGIGCAQSWGRETWTG